MSERKRKLNERKPVMGETWVHVKSENEYAVIRSCQVKMDGDWVHGIIYQKEQKVYVRPMEDFVKKFVRKVG